MKHSTLRQIIAAARVIARLIAVGVSAFVLFVAFGEGIEFDRLITEEWLLLAAMVTAVVGLILIAVPPYGQKRRILAGVILNVGGVAAFYLLNLKFSGRLPGGWVFPLMFVPGVIESVCRMAEPLPEAAYEKM